MSASHVPSRYAGRWSRGVLVTSVPFLAVFGVVLLGDPLFEGNDDTGLAMVGAGFGLAVEPEPHLVFSHYAYGLLLNAISHFAGPNAHGWITLTALGLSMALFMRAACARTHASWSLIGVTLAIAGCCVFARALLQPQFTITAAVLFGAAIGCWLTASPDERRSPPLLLAIYCAVIMSFLIRPVSGLLGLTVVGPALLWRGLLGPTEDRKPTRHLILALAGIALAVYLVDQAAYAFSPEWRDALEYNQLRSLFNDFYRIPWIAGAPEFQRVGWSANDYAMFMNWYALHPIFDYDNVKFLAQSLTQKTPLFVLSGVPRWLLAAWESPILVLLVPVPFFLWLLVSQHRVFVLLVLLGGTCAIVISALSGRPPQFRVWFSVVSVALLCVLPLLLAAETRLRLTQKAIVAAIVVIAIFVGMRTIDGHREVAATAAAYRAALSEAKSHFSGIVISWATSLAWQWLVTPTTVHAPIAGLTIPSIGLFVKMPIMEATLRHLGIADLGVTLCTRPDVRLIAIEQSVRQLETFCQEHYGVRPTFVLVFSHPRTAIYRSVRSDQPQ